MASDEMQLDDCNNNNNNKTMTTTAAATTSITGTSLCRSYTSTQWLDRGPIIDHQTGWQSTKNSCAGRRRCVVVHRVRSPTVPHRPQFVPAQPRKSWNVGCVVHCGA